ncbi:putative Glutamic acid alanine rich protein of Trypanosoma [Trypanosoma vivax]|nr:putative Glutamic acid alanine rich protein of Trypanosoma [Trypanosoma vivax]
MTGLRTAWLLVAALCCACALAHDGHDGHDDGNRQDGERKPDGGEQKPDGDDGAKGGNESEEEDPYALKLVEFACEVAGQLRGVNASAETHASALRQSVAKTADYLAEAEKKAAEAANKNESKEVIQKRAAVLAAVVSAHATVLAATANTSEVVDGVKYHAERLLKGLDEYFGDAQRSNASEDIKDVAKSCAAAPAAADVSSASVDGVKDAAAKALGDEALNFAVAELTALAAQLRELERQWRRRQAPRRMRRRRRRAALAR